MHAYKMYLVWFVIQSYAHYDNEQVCLQNSINSGASYESYQLSRLLQSAVVQDYKYSSLESKLSYLSEPIVASSTSKPSRRGASRRIFGLASLGPLPDGRFAPAPRAFSR